MSTTRMRLGALVAAGALTFGLAACGDEDEPGATTQAATVDEADAGDEAEDEATTSETEDDTGTDTEDDTEDDTAGTDDVQESDDDAGANASGEPVPVEELLALLQEPGEEMLSSYTISMAMDLDGEQTTMEGAVDLSGGEFRMQMTMTVPQVGSVDMVLADGEMYMTAPGLTPEGMYLLAPPELMGEAADLSEADVSTQWEVWEDGAQEVVYLGEEDVDGQQMRRYQVTVDAEAAAEAAGEDATDLGMDGEIVYDVWLDEDNLMRKMVFHLGEESMEMRLDDWGQDQQIEVPDPDQVMDLGELGTGTDG